ncbi:MAG: hypothetical protein HYR88_11210 [Verrucomicrobia bacterium]|nr:hypothetical protein [Verrucomicrobiota bacterium]MBI3869374.1 hypothetical protein [Verrucomicrobiota bacterium]
MNAIRAVYLLVASALAGWAAGAASPVFSGPQAGERTTPFNVTEITGVNKGKQRDPVSENAGAPTAFIFVHTVERSLVPLLRVLDQYGAERANRLKTEVVFLFGDRVAGEERIKAVAASLKLQSRVGLSLDGAEGPGNYGLNKECMMTILAARENKVTANFALVQPGYADAPKVIEALAKICGDTNPPTAEQLTERQTGRAGGAGRMERGAAATNPGRPAEPFPGAVPDDPRLNTLLRQSLRPTNDVATVDALLKSMRERIDGDAELTRQASNGWVRALHFGDRYGTPYSRQKGQAFLDKLRSDALPPKK